MSKRIGRRALLFGAGALGVGAACGLPGKDDMARAAIGTPTGASAESAMTVVTSKPGVTPGQIFYTYTREAGGGGLAIATASGDVAWSQTSDTVRFQNFQRQTYKGQHVYTWWQGAGGPEAGGTGLGTGVISELYSRDEVARVEKSGDFEPDGHEFRLTRRGTALITSYLTVPHDLTPVGGPADGEVLNSYAEEVDIATGKVLFRWSALKHVPMVESYIPPPADRAYDYFHINSISIAPDGNLLISGRQTCTLYKVHRQTGKVIWRLGGKRSDFTFPEADRFSYQHNAVFEDPGTIRLFDNGANGSENEPNQHATRVAWVKLDHAAKSAALADSMSIPGLQADAMGNAQRLPGGNVFVNWGAAARISEFTPDGELVFDANLPTTAYRAFKFQTRS